MKSEKREWLSRITALENSYLLFNLIGTRIRQFCYVVAPIVFIVGLSSLGWLLYQCWAQKVWPHILMPSVGTWIGVGIIFFSSILFMDILIAETFLDMSFRFKKLQQKTKKRWLESPYIVLNVN